MMASQNCDPTRAGLPQRFAGLLDGISRHWPGLFAATALTALLGALIQAQLSPRFVIERHGHYGWPFVHIVRHVYRHVSEPTEIYYVPFIPGLIADLLAWAILIGCTAFVLRRFMQTAAQMQVRISTLLWVTTVAAIVLAIYRLEPRDFWIRNRIFAVEPRLVQATLLFGLGCVVHAAMRMMLFPFWLAQVLVKEIERADAVDRVRAVEEFDLRPLGDLQVGV